MLHHGRMEILGTDQSQRWREVLEEIGVYDFYHLPEFHRLAEMRSEGKAFMPVYRKGGISIAFPMLIRDISLPGAEGLKDATSVNGFAGPLSSTEDVPDEARTDFHSALQELFEARGVVSVYSRLHPLIDQSSLLDGYGDTVELGVMVAIDLTPSPEEQVSHYRKSHRYEIQRLRKMGFRCEEVGADQLDDFLRVYYETMDRVNADQVYYYDKGYFEYLMCRLPGVMRCFMCKDGNHIACAGIFAECNGLVHYLYSGTASNYLRWSPSKLMVDVVREWSNSVGARVLHLGGGGSGTRDSLYQFKCGFGAREHAYATWRLIVDPDIYSDLCSEASYCTGREPKGTYFPAYRDPELQEASGGER